MPEQPSPNNDVRILEEGRKLFAGECTFVLGAAALIQVPDSNLPE
ncbi:MAG: ribosome biogenesis GTP-binding protein YihA/YsxC, partial [Acidimicrobiales bacterium]